MGAHRRQIIRRRKIMSINGKSRGCDSEPGSSNTGLDEQLGPTRHQQQPRGAEFFNHGGNGEDCCSLADGKSDLTPLTLNCGRAVQTGPQRQHQHQQQHQHQKVQQQFRYHPADVDRSEALGYAGRLSHFHETTLGALRQWLSRESVELTPLLGNGKTCPPEDEELALLRFLRHKGWDLLQTKIQLKDNLRWRVETGVPAALERDPWEVAGCKNEATFEELCQMYYPHYVLGTDRLGRPVLVQKYGKFDTSKLQKYTTLAGLLRYHAWEQEKNAELLRRATIRTGYLVDTYAMIMDFKGMGLSLVNRDFLWLLGELSEMDRKYYPGRGGVTYIINTPPLFGFVWKGIRTLTEGTQARIHIFGKEEEWKPALEESIDPSQLPPEYGGTAPALADIPSLPAVHRFLEQEAMGLPKLAVNNIISVSEEAVVERSPSSSVVTADISMASILKSFSLTTDECRSGSCSDGRRGSGCAGSSHSGDNICGSSLKVGSGQEDHNVRSIGEENKSPMQNREGISGKMLSTGLSSPHQQEVVTLTASDSNKEGLGWVMRVVPGAYLLAVVAEALTTTTVRVTLSTAEFAADCAEAVVPEHIWAGVVRAFEVLQALGQWALGL